MATFGPISSAAPNVLFDPAAAMGAAQNYQRNELMMKNAAQDQQAQSYERDVAARIGLARQFADLPDDVLAKEWGPAVQRMNQAGLGIGLDPSKPPDREHLKQIAASDLTSFQRLQGEHLSRQDAELARYHEGMLGVAQQRAAIAGAARRSGGRGGSRAGAIELVPLGVPASAEPAAPPATGGTTAGPVAPVPAPDAPQMSEAAPAPDAGGPALRLGGVDVAGPGAPPAPAPAPAGPPPGVRMMVQNGKPITQGLPTGKAWGVDAAGARVVVQIPGAVPEKPPPGPAPPIGGNGLDSALMNILVTGDPSSPAYAAAFARLGAEEVMANGVTRRPDMSPFRAPTYRPPGVMEPGTAKIPEGGRGFGRAEVGEATPPGPSTGDRSKLKQAETDAASIISALDGYTERLAKAGPGERIGTAAGLPSGLATTYNSAALLAKGESLFNLGVLNGPDLDILRKTLADPTTVRGGLAGPETVKDQADIVKKLLNERLETARQQFGGQKPAGTAETKPEADPLEGRTITNGTTGEKMIRRGGKWEPM